MCAGRVRIQSKVAQIAETQRDVSMRREGESRELAGNFGPWRSPTRCVTYQEGTREQSGKREIKALGERVDVLTELTRRLTEIRSNPNSRRFCSLPRQTSHSRSGRQRKLYIFAADITGSLLHEREAGSCRQQHSGEVPFFTPRQVQRQDELLQGRSRRAFVAAVQRFAEVAQSWPFHPVVHHEERELGEGMLRTMHQPCWVPQCDLEGLWDVTTDGDCIKTPHARQVLQCIAPHLPNAA